MEPLSQHFRTTEFEHGTEIPADCLPVFRYLCQFVLEPIRARFAATISITSGYRTPETNAATHGATHSEHIATDRYCAADFYLTYINEPTMPIRAVFDWIRNNPELPFHQVILEEDAGGAILHVSVNLDKPGQRQALTGATHNQTAYANFEVAPYNPTQPVNLQMLES